MGREESVRAVEYSLQNTNRVLILAAQKDINIDNPKENDLYNIATASLIVKTRKLPDGRIKVLVQGLHKINIKEYLSSNPYVFKYDVVDDNLNEKVNAESKAMMGLVRDNFDTKNKIKY